jgi:hypothetical protein
LYNIQHEDYDNNFSKHNCWKEIAGELNAQDNELSRRTQHCQRMAGEWHGMCKSAFNVHIPTDHMSCIVLQNMVLGVCNR